jgi:hypothetical protein
MILDNTMLFLNKKAGPDAAPTVHGTETPGATVVGYDRGASGGPHANNDMVVGEGALRCVIAINGEGTATAMKVEAISSASPLLTNPKVHGEITISDPQTDGVRSFIIGANAPSLRYLGVRLTETLAADGTYTVAFVRDAQQDPVA